MRLGALRRSYVRSLSRHLYSYHAAAVGRTEHRTVMEKECTHLNQIKILKPTSHVCQECIDMGDRWVHLRMCLICGYLACCDDSKNKHATKHFHSKGPSADALHRT